MNPITKKSIKAEKTEILERYPLFDAKKVASSDFGIDIAGIPFPTAVFCENGQILTVNHIWTALTGYTESDLLTINDWCRLAFPGRGQEIIGRINFLFSNPHIGLRKSETIITKDHQLRHWDFGVSAITGSPGNRLLLITAIDSTEYKKIEHDLLKSKADMEAVFENSLQSIILVDVSGIIQTFNRKAYNGLKDFFGKEMCAGQNAWDLLPQDYCIQFADSFKQVVKGETISHELKVRNGSNKSRWVEFVLSPVFQGETVEAVCISCLDIDEKKSVADQIVASEQRFRSLVQNSSDIITVVDSLGMIIYQSDSCQRILGYRPEELIGKRFLDFVSSESVFEVGSTLDIIANNNGKTHKIEYQVYHKDGSLVYLESFVNNLLSDDRVSGIVINSRDITAGKRAAQALQESKLLIQRIADASPNILFLYDLEEDRLIYINQTMTKVLGFSYDDIRTFTLDKYFELIHTDDVECRKRSLSQLDFLPDNEICECEYRLKDKEGEWHWMYNRETVFSRNVHGLPKQVLGTAEDITHRKSIEAQLAHEAQYDSLTGLPNRRYFMDHLQQVISRYATENNSYAVLFLDIDRFKIINDSLGHTIGDHLLVSISRRLKSIVGSNGLVARLGGDEFIILFECINNLQEVVKYAENIQKKLTHPFVVHRTHLTITSSIGIAVSGSKYSTAEAILRDADTAMYRAKSRGRNCYAVFNQQMHTHVMRLLKVESDLRRALEKDEFELFYQPILCLRTGGLSSAEVLLRWNHPQKGVLLPTEFLPIAEETGMILQIDKWVLNNACRQNQAWIRQGKPKIKISVNLSLKQLKQRNLVDLVQRTLARTGLQPQYLDLELTENVLIDYSDSAILLFNQLKEMGVSLSIDDFGTGYSSLKYLQKLPVTSLKIDQSFIQNVATDTDSKSIVQTIITLAHNLKIEATAEGVEYGEQLHFLEKHKCDFVQGYFFSGPLSASEFAKVLSKPRFIYG